MDIFRTEADFEYMRHCLREARVGRGVVVHSYVLMTNHIHLLVTAEDDTGVSRFVQSAAVRYVARFNKKYQRTGTLWEGRFYSAVVTTDRYLMACHRYIDANPVRAGLAACAADYPWSSHRYHAYGAEDDLVCAHPVILALGENAPLRRLAYARMGMSELADSEIEAIRTATHKRRVLGERPAQRSGPIARPGIMVSDTNFGGRAYSAGQGTARSAEPA